jgi:hypothetical protein
MWGLVSSKQVLTSSCLLHLQHPTLDFGTVAVGSRKTLYLKAENSALLTQVCGVLRAAQQKRLTCRILAGLHHLLPSRYRCQLRRAEKLAHATCRYSVCCHRILCIPL